jgi:hypothetical protein
MKTWVKKNSPWLAKLASVFLVVETIFLSTALGQTVTREAVLRDLVRDVIALGYQDLAAKCQGLTNAAGQLALSPKPLYCRGQSIPARRLEYVRFRGKAGQSPAPAASRAWGRRFHRAGHRHHAGNRLAAFQPEFNYGRGTLSLGGTGGGQIFPRIQPPDHAEQTGHGGNR